MENPTIQVASVDDIRDFKNVHNLSMITKMDIKLGNSSDNNDKNENTKKIRNVTFEDSLRMNEEQMKVKEAVFILQNLENFKYSITYTEIQNIRNDLKLFAVNSFHDHKYSDCLIQSIHSYMIAKKYYSKFYGFYLTGDMSTELILICKCYVLIEKYKEGQPYLQELKFLIDNTLLHWHKKGKLESLDKSKQQATNVKKDVSSVPVINKGDATLESGGSIEEPIISCEVEVLMNLLYIFSDLLSLYKENTEAEKYYLKYLLVTEKRFGENSLNYSDALNDVCTYYIKVREYSKALKICERILEIRKQFFGDYNADKPSEIIADCYANLGLLLRLSGNPVEALHNYLKAVDMRMRIHKTRNVIQVQDILYSFAIIMHQLNNYKIALQLYREVYTFYKNHYGSENMNTTMVLKLIEELDKDILTQSNKKEIRDNKLVLDDRLFNTNENEKYKEKQKNKAFQLYNESFKQKPYSFSSPSTFATAEGDVDPNLIDKLMNKKVLLKTKDTCKSLSNKKTILTLEGNFRYTDLSYPSIDAYRNMQSNKQFEILKSSIFTSSSINRVKSLYADTWKNTLIPSTYILPFVETKLADETLVNLSRCKDFQDAIIFKRKILPVVNIPLIQRGHVKLENDEPVMVCNDDAKILLKEWNVKEPFVNAQGVVFDKYENAEKQFSIYLPILDEKNEIMLGFYNNPLMVPNPAIYHCLILSEPNFFTNLNRDIDRRQGRSIEMQRFGTLPKANVFLKKSSLKNGNTEMKQPTYKSGFNKTVKFKAISNDTKAVSDDVLIAQANSIEKDGALKNLKSENKHENNKDNEIGITKKVLLDGKSKKFASKFTMKSGNPNGSFRPPSFGDITENNINPIKNEGEKSIGNNMKKNISEKNILEKNILEKKDSEKVPDTAPETVSKTVPKTVSKIDPKALPQKSLLSKNLFLKKPEMKKTNVKKAAPNKFIRKYPSLNENNDDIIPTEPAPKEKGIAKKEEAQKKMPAPPPAEKVKNKSIISPKVVKKSILKMGNKGKVLFSKTDYKAKIPNTRLNKLADITKPTPKSSGVIKTLSKGTAKKMPSVASMKDTSNTKEGFIEKYKRKLFSNKDVLENSKRNVKLQKEPVLRSPFHQNTSHSSSYTNSHYHLNLYDRNVDVNAKDDSDIVTPSNTTIRTVDDTLMSVTDSHHGDIQMDLHTPMKEISRFDTRSFKREIFYDDSPISRLNNSFMMSSFLVKEDHVMSDETTFDEEVFDKTAFFQKEEKRGPTKVRRKKKVHFLKKKYELEGRKNSTIKNDSDISSCSSNSSSTSSSSSVSNNSGSNNSSNDIYGKSNITKGDRYRKTESESDEDLIDIFEMFDVESESSKTFENIQKSEMNAVVNFSDIDMEKQMDALLTLGGSEQVAEMVVDGATTSVAESITEYGVEHEKRKEKRMENNTNEDKTRANVFSAFDKVRLKEKIDGMKYMKNVKNNDLSIQFKFDNSSFINYSLAPVITSVEKDLEEGVEVDVDADLDLDADVDVDTDVDVDADENTDADVDANADSGSERDVIRRQNIRYMKQVVKEQQRKTKQKSVTTTNGLFKIDFKTDKTVFKDETTLSKKTQDKEQTQISESMAVGENVEFYNELKKETFEGMEFFDEIPKQIEIESNSDEQQMSKNGSFSEEYVETSSEKEKKYTSIFENENDADTENSNKHNELYVMSENENNTEKDDISEQMQNDSSELDYFVEEKKTNKIEHTNLQPISEMEREINMDEYYRNNESNGSNGTYESSNKRKSNDEPNNANNDEPSSKLSDHGYFIGVTGIHERGFSQSSSIEELDLNLTGDKYKSLDSELYVDKDENKESEKDREREREGEKEEGIRDNEEVVTISKNGSLNSKKEQKERKQKKVTNLHSLKEDEYEIKINDDGFMVYFEGEHNGNERFKWKGTSENEEECFSDNEGNAYDKMFKEFNNKGDKKDAVSFPINENQKQKKNTKKGTKNNVRFLNQVNKRLPLTKIISFLKGKKNKNNKHHKSDNKCDNNSDNTNDNKNDNKNNKKDSKKDKYSSKKNDANVTNEKEIKLVDGHGENQKIEIQNIALGSSDEESSVNGKRDINLIEEPEKQEEKGKWKNRKKKYSFISEASHGMDKPKLKPKPKFMLNVKKLGLSKEIKEKPKFPVKKETVMKMKEISKTNKVTGETKAADDINDENVTNADTETEKAEMPNGGTVLKTVPNEKETTKSGSSPSTPMTGEKEAEKSAGDDSLQNQKMLTKMSTKILGNKTISEKNKVPENLKEGTKISAKGTTGNSNEEIKKTSIGISQEVIKLKSITDPLPYDFLKQVKYCKIGCEEDVVLGFLPNVELLNEQKVVIAVVPWQIDLTSFTLAKSSIEESVIRKLGLMSRKQDYTKEERLKQAEKEISLLSGEGLKSLGLLRDASAGKGVIHDTDLIAGIDMAAINKMKKAAQMVDTTKGKEKDAVKKEEKAKDAAPKETSKAKGKGKAGGKGPPKGMKGPPKGGPKSADGKAKAVKGKGVKDEGKTKRFFWEALFEEDVKGTLFEEKRDLIQKIEIEKESVETCFSKAAPKKDEAKESKIKKPKVIQLLPDSKREYNMSIALAKFNNYTFKQIRDAIVELDPQILNIDNTEVLLQYAPTPEESEIVKEFINSGGDLNLVDKPEQYVAALIGVPLLKQRLESHYFALAFKENYENALSPLENILESCEAIKNSNNLFTILFTILNVGNTLNYGDQQRGNAFGFKLTTLAKLNDIRSSTRPVKTLMQYICEIIYEKNPETLNIIEELRCIEKAVKVEKQTIDTYLQKIKVGATKIKNVIEVAKKIQGDPLEEALSEFYRSVEPKIGELETFYEQTFDAFKRVASYLGYKEKDLNTVQVHDFFNQLWTFVKDVEFNRKNLVEATLKKAKKQEQELLKQKKEAMKIKKQLFKIPKKSLKGESEQTKEKEEKKTFKIF